MEVQIDFYVGGKQKFKGIPASLLVEGKIVGSMSVNRDDALQTIGTSIYDYVRNNQIVDYKTYTLILSGTQTTPHHIQVPRPGYHQNWRLPEGWTMEDMFNERKRHATDQVVILLPNDIYVTEYGALKVKDLPLIMGGLDLTQPLRADIGPKFDIGLSALI